MSSSPAQLQLSPSRTPSLSSVFPRTPSRDPPATPTTVPSNPKHAPPTPPDSSSRAAAPTVLASPSCSNPDISSDLSLSAALSSSAPQFQSRLLDTPIDIHYLAPELESPDILQEISAECGHDDAALLKSREQISPTPTQEAVLRKLAPESLPPPFVPAAAYSQQGDQERETDSSSPDSRPPNVYINGLPPNFPEEDLLAMTSPFGNVMSVRTFTRHVSDKPSGYGFVLFETLESAERCIVSLRKYRNLHPSFSKQVHKIPGTTYSSVPSALTSNTGPADSFKAKMEQLSDTSSTNLYMEGLPLSITEETLKALITPYRIMSSRFFHTRLSSPPRIIAFVRLESRVAAEDIIERLHGRLVRGWNDAGCRISVRFADTAEQRELRRAERQNREGEQSPARLTMARAALLNLKGTQCHAGDRSPSLNDGLNALPNQNLGLALDQLAFGQLNGQISPITAVPSLPVQDPLLRAAITAQELTSLGVNVSTYDSLNSRAPQVSAHGLRIPTTQQFAGNTSSLLDNSSAELQLLMSMQGLHTIAQNGYTPVEQLILQAHARQQRAVGIPALNGDGQSHLQSLPSNATVGIGANSAGRETTRRLLDFSPQMSEDDFHATAGLQRALPGGENESVLTTGEHFASLAHDLERQMALSAQQTRQRNHTLAAQARPDVDTQGLHVRATTLPSQYLDIRSHSTTTSIPIYDSNISLSSTSNRNSLRNGTNLHVTSSKHRPLAPVSNITTPRNISTSNANASTLPDTQTLFSSKNNINVSSTVSRIGMKSATTANPTAVSSAAATRLHKTPSGATATGLFGRGVAIRPPGNPQDADDEDDRSPIVSPALTYSARTPASLSPATPYTGFFCDGGDAFHGTGVGVVGVGELGLLETNVGEKQKSSADAGGQ